MAGTVSVLVLHALLQFLWCPGALGEELFPLILPEPKVMEQKGAEKLRLAAGDSVEAVLVANATIPKALIGAEEINKQVKRLGFKPLAVLDERSAGSISDKVLILIGNASENRLTKQLFSAADTGKRNAIRKPRGYTLEITPKFRDPSDFTTENILKLVEEDHKHYSMGGDYDPQLDADTLQLRDMWRQEGPR